MTVPGQEKVLSMLVDTERVADQILVNKQEIVELDKKRQINREALNQMKRTSDKSIWTSVGCVILKLQKDSAVSLLEEDQKAIETDIEKLRQDQKLLVNKLRDIEHDAPLKGFDLKHMNYADMSAFKANLH